MATFLNLSCLVLLASLCPWSQASSLHFRTENDQERISENPDTSDYYFAADGMTKPYRYVDKYGALVGFDIDLISAVCEVADKNCYSILAQTKECSFTDRKKKMDYAGSGLQSKWYSGCSGYEVTDDRLINHDFTLPYLKTSASFAVPRDNPKKFDPESMDFSDFVLVHVSGESTNCQCLRRMGRQYKRIEVADSMSEARELVRSGKADVLFSHTEVFDDLEVLPQRMQCSGHGHVGLMLPKGSHIAHWWNKAFRDYYLSGQYTTLCEVAEEKYGAKPRCIPGPKDASPELLSIMRSDDTVDDVSSPQRLWKFVVSGTSPNYSYLDKKGRIQGFTKVLMEEVCKRAGERCTMVTAEVKECIEREGLMQYPGRGLLEGWFDSCTGYYNNIERRNSWDFTEAYLFNYATFQVLPGNPKGFQPNMTDYSKFTIAYSAHSESNDHCLNRLKKKFDKVYIASSRGKAAKAVMNGDADVLFSTILANSKHLETLPGKFHCDKVGTAMMLRKGSKIPSWWDPAWREYYESGEFNDMCDDLTKYYGFDFPCVPRPEDRREMEDSLEGF